MVFCQQSQDFGVVYCLGFGRECVPRVCVQRVHLGILEYRIRMAGATNPRGLYSRFVLGILGFRIRKFVATKLGVCVQGLCLGF